jgi:hypothetical protein
MFKNAPNARTQREALVEALKRGASPETHDGICWEHGGVTRYRTWAELTPAQRKLANA